MTSFRSFAELCQCVERVNSALEKIDLVAEFLVGLDAQELAVVPNFIMGLVITPGSDLVMGVGPSILYEALKRGGGCSSDQISEWLRVTGDIGLVAFQVVEKKKPIGFAAFTGENQISISELHKRFMDIAKASGKRSQNTKIKNLQYLFSQSSPLEALYIARLASEDLRIGIGEGAVRDAIAKAFHQPVDLVERSYNLTNDMGLVALNARKGTLSQLTVMLNHPMKMMLAQLGESIPTAFKEMGSAAIEWKFDGARVQIHMDGKRIRIYSRRLENVTSSLPDIVGTVSKHVHAECVILDGEVVAISEDGRPRAFQEILKRFRRKYNVESLVFKIPLSLFLFDIIYLNGKSLVDLSLFERRAILTKVVDKEVIAEQVVSDKSEIADEIYHKALEAGHEGIMIKNPSSIYAPGKRGKNWLKIKPVMETLDLVVIGARWGEGRRATFFGSYRLACSDPATGRLLDVGWVATGLTDEALAELTEIFKDLVLFENGIFEVAYEEIQSSPNYSSGYALRFPRLVAVRDDKSLEDADTVERIVSLYKLQRGRNSV
jgi:DNA ligase-1